MLRSVFPCLFSLCCLSTALAQDAHPVYFKGLDDMSLFLKPRFTNPNVWDQQFGLRARLMRDGNFSAEYSIAYDPTYPIKWDKRPVWTTGIQFAYFFTKAPFPVAVYTTPKYNLVRTWKEEYGLNLRLVQQKRVYVNSSLDYQSPYPYVGRAKPPAFQASLTVGFPF